MPIIPVISIYDIRYHIAYLCHVVKNFSFSSVVKSKLENLYIPRQFLYFSSPLYLIVHHNIYYCINYYCCRVSVPYRVQLPQSRPRTIIIYLFYRDDFLRKLLTSSRAHDFLAFD